LDLAYWRTHLPRYPTIAFRAGVEGEVVLRVDVGADGRAIGVVVEQSAGNPHLDRAAMEALRTHPFLPATAAGQPVIGRTRVTAPFVIGGRTLDTTRAVDLRSEPTAASSP
ncbi:energy transducer TonB, partial [Stenotrophomonas sp.]|uniref:energy transducer TonB n=1 Tax=Stenotrophomonas sp. TaxID=69392 RepID=UPI002FC92E63